MGSGFDLGRLISSVLLSFFVLAGLTFVFTEMGRGLGNPLTQNATFSFENTLNASERIDRIVTQNATSPSSISSFVPGVGLFVDVLTALKDATTGVMKDVRNLFNTLWNMVSEVGGGSKLFSTLKVILITVIILSIAFIVIGALLRTPTFRQGG